MLRIRVIPCLDVANGRVVKGTRFVDLTDEGDPPELAERYAREGADELVFLDISAAPEGRGTLLEIVERTARRAFIPLTVGGGVRSVDEMRDVLRAGADKVSLNTAAVADPELIGACARRFGSQAVVVAIDARAIDAGGAAWEVVVKGGREATGLDAVAWAEPRHGARRRRAARHLDRPRRDAVGLRHGAAPRDHRRRDGPGHRVRRRRGPGRLRPGGRRRRRRRGPRGVDLPPPPALDRRRQGRDGRRGAVGPGGRRVIDPDAVRFGADGLVPAIVRDAADGEVLMLAWMDREALDATLATGDVHFHSRSRDALWRKGETSGNTLRVRAIAADCDADALLVTADPAGPTCHRGTRTLLRRRGRAAVRREPRPRASPGSRSSGRRSPIAPRRGRRAPTPPACSNGGVDAAARKVTEEARRS